MTFHLDSGLEIRVPNDQFLTPFVDVNREGKRVVDKSKRELLVNAVGNQPATLGRYFLTAAYLMVNHDANTFTLWQANPSSSSNLVRVLDEEAASQCNDDNSVVQPSNSVVVQPSNGVVHPSKVPSATPQDTTGEPPEDEGPAISSGPSVAVIGGAVGGGVGALVILGVVGFFILRRWKRRSGRASGVGSSNNSSQGYGEKKVDYMYPYRGTFNSPMVQEMPGSRPQPFEMHGEGMAGMLYELDAHPTGRGSR